MAAVDNPAPQNQFAWWTTVAVTAVVIIGMALKLDPMAITEFAAIITGVTVAGAVAHSKIN